MARDSSLQLRKAVLTTLRADTPLLALVPAVRIYGVSPPAKPTWPFVRYGFASTVPLRASCLDGGQVAFAVHGFAKGVSEDDAAQIGAAIASALDGITIELGTTYPATAHIVWTGSQMLRDTDEAGAYHTVVQFDAGVSS